MNKSRSIRTAFLAAAVSILALNAAQALEATVVSTTGKTEFQKMGESAWKQLEVGTKLSKGAVISTGFKSQLVLKINESTISVAPLTRMTIEQLVAKPSKDETRVFLNTGSIKADVKHTQDRRTGFTVRSPVATASVRGTIIEAKMNYKSTDIACSRGKVAVKQNIGDLAQPQLSTDDEDNETEQPTNPSVSNSPTGSTSGPSAGESTISENQTTSFSESGDQTSAQSKADNNAKSVGSTSSSAASTENESMGDSSAGTQSGTTTESSSKKTASVIVKVSLE